MNEQLVYNLVCCDKRLCFVLFVLILILTFIIALTAIVLFHSARGKRAISDSAYYVKPNHMQDLQDVQQTIE